MPILARSSPKTAPGRTAILKPRRLPAPPPKRVERLHEDTRTSVETNRGNGGRFEGWIDPKLGPLARQLRGLLGSFGDSARALMTKDENRLKRVQSQCCQLKDPVFEEQMAIWG